MRSVVVNSRVVHAHGDMRHTHILHTDTPVSCMYLKQGSTSTRINIKVPHGCCFRLASLELYDQPVRQSREHAGNRLQLPRRAPLRGPTSQLPNLGLHSMEIPEPIGLLRLDTAGHARA